MRSVSISIADVRRRALRAQSLDRPPRPSGGKDGVAETIERLGYVQIDTIAVVRRAHHHVLWTRCADYDPEMLHDLQAVDRRVFEYWAHAIAVLPMSDYRYYVPQMKRIRDGGAPWMREWHAKHGDVLDAVRARIRAEGPLTSKDFEPPPGTKRGTWWDWKPAKRALELLFWQGDLMVAERRNFQKVYDLTERVLPPDVDTTAPSDEACGRFQVRRALGALGVAREREILEFVKVVDNGFVRRGLEELVEDGEVVCVEVEGGPSAYALAARLEEESGASEEPRVRLLSPFDGLVIQRPRNEWLFGFQYTLECYQPREKRQYGYYVLPILYDGRLVGRLDPKADRKTETLTVHGLWLEPGFKPDDGFLAGLGQALARFAAFNGCGSVRVERSSPTRVRAAVARHARRDAGPTR